MNELQVFNFEKEEVRTLRINNEPYFVGKDIAEILGYSNSRKALIDHVDEEDKGVTKCDTVIVSNQEQAKSNVYRNMKKDLKIKRIEWKFPNVRLIVFNPKNDEEYRVHFEKDLLEWIAFISATIIWILLCSIFLKWLI